MRILTVQVHQRSVVEPPSVSFSEGVFSRRVIVSIESQGTGTIDGEVCSVWFCSNEQIETEMIAEFVAREIEYDGLNPRDFALLVRQKASEFEKRLKPAFFFENWKFETKQHPWVP